MGTVMFGINMLNAWKRENVVIGGWMLYISIFVQDIEQYGRNDHDMIGNMDC